MQTNLCEVVLERAPGKTPEGVQPGVTVKFGLDVHAAQITVCRQLDGLLTQPPQRDSVRLALQLQRSVVALHPFDRGNGRVSRWVLDYLLLRQGLPPALILDMNRDLSQSEEAYRIQSLNGMAQGLNLMEECLGRYEAALNSDESVRQARLRAVQGSRCGLVR